MCSLRTLGKHPNDVKEGHTIILGNSNPERGERMVPSPAMGGLLVCSRKSWKINGKG